LLLFIFTFAMERAAVTARHGISDFTFAMEWVVISSIMGVGLFTYHSCVGMLYDAAGPWVYVREQARSNTAVVAAAWL
jgi:hypothetical protein